MILPIFEEIFGNEIERDSRRFLEKPGDYQQFRALKETLRSSNFENLSFNPDEAQKLAAYLLKEEKYSKAFQDWIRTKELHATLNTLPRNTGLVLNAGKLLINNK